MAMPVLNMRHERETLPLHPVATQPQARNVRLIKRAMNFDGVVLDLFGRLEGLHAVAPLADERRLGVGLDWRSRLGG